MLLATGISAILLLLLFVFPAEVILVGYRPYILLIGGVGLGGILIHWCFDLESRLKQRSALQHLTADEQEILQRYVRQSVRTVQFLRREAVVGDMVVQNLLRPTSASREVEID